MYECNLSLLHCSGDLHYVSDIDELKSLLTNRYGLNHNSYYILHNGKRFSYSCIDNIEVKCPLHVVPTTLGGKGGFGSMLRAIGAQIEKTTNREACRDLSGRRLRDINEEQRLKNWISQQADREKEAAERKQKKLERLCQEPKHDFKDEQYEETRSNLTDVISNSIEEGMKAGTSGIEKSSLKRKVEKEVNKPAKKKKKNLWIDADGSSSTSSDDEGRSEVNTDVVSSNI